MNTIILIIVCFGAGVYAHKYKIQLKALLTKLWEKVGKRKNEGQ